LIKCYLFVLLNKERYHHSEKDADMIYATGMLIALIENHAGQIDNYI